METPERFYDAALVCIELICDKCRATLASEDLPGGQHRSTDKGYFVPLGDEAFRRGWYVTDIHSDPLVVLCPACAKQANL